jgi:hypothetical protein
MLPGEVVAIRKANAMPQMIGPMNEHWRGMGQRVEIAGPKFVSSGGRLNWAKSRMLGVQLIDKEKPKRESGERGEEGFHRKNSVEEIGVR